MALGDNETHIFHQQQQFQHGFDSKHPSEAWNSLASALQGTILSTTDRSTSVGGTRGKSAVDVVQSIGQTSGGRSGASGIGNSLEAVGDLVELAAMWGWGWGRWRASRRASSRASGALGTTDQGCSVFLGILDAVTNTVVGVSEDAVESLTLTRKLRGGKGVCGHGEHSEGKKDLGGGRHLVWWREKC